MADFNFQDVNGNTAEQKQVQEISKACSWQMFGTDAKASN